MKERIKEIHADKSNIGTFGCVVGAGSMLGLFIWVFYSAITDVVEVVGGLWTLIGSIGLVLFCMALPYICSLLGYCFTLGIDKLLDWNDNLNKWYDNFNKWRTK